MDLKFALAESADINCALGLGLRRGNAARVDVILHDMNVRLSDIRCQEHNFTVAFWA